MRKIMASLDIGNDTIKLVVGEMFRSKLHVLAALSEKTKGIKNNVIYNEALLIDTLKGIFDKVNNLIGIPIKQVILTVPPNNLEFSVINGEAEVEGTNGKVKGTDIVRVIKNSLKGKISEDKEYIAMLPTSFIVDDGRKVRDPKGLESKILRSRGVLITSPKKEIYDILVILSKVGVEAIDISLNAIGDYYEYKIDEMKDLNGIIVNIGHEKTDISLFNKGILTNTSVVNIGGKNIDGDISYVYKTDLEESKKIKEQFAFACTKKAKADIKYETENKSNEKIVINQYEVSKIVQSRIEEILNLCKKHINLLTKKEISYIIITGGLTESRDFNLILNKVFKEKAIVGKVSELGVRHNKYGSAVGLIKYFDDKSKLKDKDYSIFSLEEQQALGGYDLDEKSDLSLAELFKNLFN